MIVKVSMNSKRDLRDDIRIENCGEMSVAFLDANTVEI